MKVANTSRCIRVYIVNLSNKLWSLLLFSQNVAKLKSEHSHWLTDEATMLKQFGNLEGANMKETIDSVNKAEEGERTRRMSIPFSCDIHETDLDLSVTSGQLSNVHQELLHLFAIHDVSSKAPFKWLSIVISEVQYTSY